MVSFIDDWVCVLPVLGALAVGSIVALAFGPTRFLPLDRFKLSTSTTMLGGAINATLPPVLPENVKDPVRVSQIVVHPIKSCKGISVQEARYTPVGLEYDRRWAIIDAKSQNVVTAREFHKMVLISPRIIADSTSPHNGVLRVEFPADSSLPRFDIPLEPSEELLNTWERLTSIAIWTSSGLDAYVCQALGDSPQLPSAMLSEFLEREVYLILKGPKPRHCDPTPRFSDLGTPDRPATVDFQDGYPLLVASTESLAETASRVQRSVGVVSGVISEWASVEQKELRMERFRPNIVFEGAGVPFAEDAWEEITIIPEGGFNNSTSPITLVSRCTRCLLPNVDPTTGVRDAAVPFKVLAKFRTKLDPRMPNKSCFGMNGVPSGLGVVRIGDRIEVLKWAKD